MTKLSTLRSRLGSLRRRRQSARLGTGYLALITAVLCILVGAFLIDISFQREMTTGVRAFALLIYAGIAFWAFRRYTAPFLGHQETDVDMALLVERQQLDPDHRDLVAAMQFETPEASKWGSQQLKNAVIDYVAEFGKGLNVFEGFSREQFNRRITALVAAAAVVVGIVLISPQYAGIFANRLALGSKHYPTNTQIDRVIVNYQKVLGGDLGTGAAPSDSRSPQGKPVTFIVQCSGDLPVADDTSVSLTRRTSSQNSSLEMGRLTLDDRRERLSDAMKKIGELGGEKQTPVTSAWTVQVASLVSFDAPEVAELVVAAAGDHAKLTKAAEGLAEVLEAWPGDADQTALYTAKIERLSDAMVYQLELGDAWTDLANVDMVPLPVVDAQLVVTPPKYALAYLKDETVEPSSLHRAVLRGSHVAVNVACKNKSLKSAQITIEGKVFDLKKTDSDGHAWELADDSAPLHFIKGPIGFEIQVTDEDDLQLEHPRQGYIRLRTDRRPQVIAGIMQLYLKSQHTVPTATRTIKYEVSDDFGIGQVRLHAEVIRGDEKIKKDPMSLLASQKPILRGDVEFPLTQTYRLPLGSLQLAKGDRLQVKIEVIDYRGKLSGESVMSETLVFHVTDAKGAEAAALALDKSLERGIDSVIRQVSTGEKR